MVPMVSKALMTFAENWDLSVVNSAQRTNSVASNSFQGLNKMVINQLEKLFVTSDAATVIKELEVILMKIGHRGVYFIRGIYKYWRVALQYFSW